MARGGARIAHSDEDKARILATLRANGGNVSRTARECGVSPAAIRNWRGDEAHGQGPSAELITRAVGEFVEDAERVRNKALVMLEARIDEGTIKPSELITTLGVLDDKIVRAKGMPTSKVEHSSALPPADELRALMSGFVSGAIAASERREAEIVEAEVVEVLTLPETT